MRLICAILALLCGIALLIKMDTGTLTPDQVAAAALRGLGRGPRVVPGLAMRLSSAVMSRLPRRTAIAIISRASRDPTPPAR